MGELTQEEIEHRRYLKKRIRQRKRRRKVMIARAVVLLIVIMLFAGIFGIVKLVYNNVTGESRKVTTKPSVTILPEETDEPITVDLPDGYDIYYEQLDKLRDDYPEINDILLNISQYPEDLLNLVINNQETVSFAAGYPKHQGDTEASGSISKSELGDRRIPLFQQWDKRWGYVSYGSNIIAIDGCGPTCMSMVYTGITGDTSKSPADIAEFCSDNNYYDSENGTSWSLMSEGAKKLGLQSEKLTVDKKNIKEKLGEGKPVICSMIPGDFTSQGHFIVLTEINGNKLRVNDPNSIRRSETDWDFDRVLEQVKAAWSYYAG